MRSRKSLIQTAILAVCLIHASAAFGSGAVEIADKALSGGQLTIGGPDGFHVSRAFKAGENLSLSMFDKSGNFLADGLYKWSLVYQGEATGDRDAYRPKVEPVTGSFMIKGGAMVNADATEGGFNKDQQILDDLIVVGSICAGQDCNNGESFGFDTLRLKENNLRIKAQDTSTSASFPTVDWQITFNDSSNGGLNKFSIDSIDNGATPFTVEFGAPSHSLYVDDGGRLGLGTNTPVVDIHVKSGNTPTLRLEQDGSSGFTQQIWDLAGNEANFFIRDATNGSTLPFRIFPGAPSNAISIEAGGDVGLGTTSPTAALHVVQGGATFTTGFGTAAVFQNTANASDFVAVSLISGNNSNTQLTFGDTDSQTAGRIVYENNTDNLEIRASLGNVIIEADNADAVLTISNDGNVISTSTSGAVLTQAGQWQSVSSRAAKENIIPMSAEDAFQAFSELEPVTYNYKAEPDELSAGFIAEDVPDLVATASRSTLVSLDLVAVLTKVTQEQQKTIEQLMARVADLEK